MSESIYISMASTSSNNESAKSNNAQDTDLITLNIVLTAQNNDISSTLPEMLDATPKPTTRKLFSKKPKNLQLKIVSPTIETDNESLSSDKLKTESKTCYYSSSATTQSTSASTNTTFPHEHSRTCKKLNIGFQNIFYQVRTGFFRSETKNILHGLSGHFRAGELSAILGPSGSGKSTCLNILSGYTGFGYSGDVTVNNNLRDVKAFKPNVSFITQDTSLHPHLTVKEAMHFSANLKIGTQMSRSAKRERVKKILEAISLFENRHTRTSQLSGGQKKRLSVALELVNNPPVLILDEPISGLDSSTSNQLISLLKKLALEGRTVICTIHQPSALTFEMFDHLYAIAAGSCIYSGGIRNLVPFLAEIGIHCPESYNPADYLMEIATDDYGSQNEKLIAKIENGKNDSYRQSRATKKEQLEAMQKVDKLIAAGLITPLTAPLLTPAFNNNNSDPVTNCLCSKTTTFSANSQHCTQSTKSLTPISDLSSRKCSRKGILSETSNDYTSAADNGFCQQMDSPQLCKRENIYATPFYRQLGILLLRTFLILGRDKSLTVMRFTIHLMTALLIGLLYYGIGNDAKNALNSFRYCFYSIMFIMYSAFSSIIVKFPLEFPIVSREHFNRWYSLRAYYVAITLADIPIQLLCTTTYIVITYTLTDQPRDLFRVVLFCGILFLTALVGQSIGLAVGASLNIKLAAILGPFFISPFIAFSGFFLQEQHTPATLKWIFRTSFLKYSLDATVMAIFGFDRPRLECTAMYCHYSRPKIFLKDIDMLDANYQTALLFLVVLFLVLRLISFYIMSFRLRLFR